MPHELKMTTKKPKHEMSMGTWLATEGGRKCPMCGRYAKARELGWLGCHTPTLCLDIYGHLPGKGCNRRKRSRHSDALSNGCPPVASDSPKTPDGHPLGAATGSAPE